MDEGQTREEENSEERHGGTVCRRGSGHRTSGLSISQGCSESQWTEKPGLTKQLSRSQWA